MANIKWSAFPTTAAPVGGDVLVGLHSATNYQISLVTVPLGGTGNASLTTYTLLAGGTTATGALQQVSAGSSGQLLQSNGAAALPSWSTATFPTSAGAAGTILRSNGTGWIASTATFADTYASGTVLAATSSNTVVGLAYSAVPGVSNIVSRDASGNSATNSFIDGYTTTATAAGTTVLTVASTYQQFFTGATTQTVTLPVTSTLVLGQQYLIVNNSSGIVTVQSSGANTVQTLSANTSVLVTCILTSGTSAASWYANYDSAGGGSVSAGTQNQLAWYAVTGDTVSGLATANNGTFVTSSAGVPSILAGPGTTGNILQSNAAAAPSFSTATYPSTTTVSQFLYSSSANVVTGLATANSAILVTNSTGVPAWSATMTNGQLIIGSTGATPTAATLTAGTGISISNGAASITINATGSGMAWSTIAGTTQTAAVDNGYISGNAGQTTVTLPATAAIGSTVGLEGLGAAGWILKASGGQAIQIGSQATSSGGTLTSAAATDNVYVVCIVANLTWRVQTTNSTGLTVA